MSTAVRLCIAGSRAYRTGVERGFSRADRMFSFDGVSSVSPPTRNEILAGSPFWVVSEHDESDFLDGYAAGFARRVAGLWPNGSYKESSHVG